MARPEKQQERKHREPEQDQALDVGNRRRCRRRHYPRREHLSSLNGIQKDGVNYETQLNAQYLDNQNELGSYISGFYEQVGVANLKSQKMDQILTDAVKGRYDGNASSAQVGHGQLFSAIQEAYPNVDLSVYDKILNYVQAGPHRVQGQAEQAARHAPQLRQLAQVRAHP